MQPSHLVVMNFCNFVQHATSTDLSGTRTLGTELGGVGLRKGAGAEEHASTLARHNLPCVGIRSTFPRKGPMLILTMVPVNLAYQYHGIIPA